MSIQLYESVCIKLCRELTHNYSTSFSLGIRLFEPKYREGIYSIYAFVRLADEIVDTFEASEREKLLSSFCTETVSAFRTGISANPVIHAFQMASRRYQIDEELITAFLESMRMDLYHASHGRQRYEDYIFGSAEAVGLMCLKVFTEGDDKLYCQLSGAARKLGSAFQKVNFLRDIKSDLEERGRIYLPDVHHENLMDNKAKMMLEEEIEQEFHEALKGILRLPVGVRLGVYSAYINYYFLLKKIRRMDIAELKRSRVRIPNYRKLLLLIRSYFEIRVLKRQVMM